jgi:DNA-directed RNA polymerase II subunit RPB1
MLWDPDRVVNRALLMHPAIDGKDGVASRLEIAATIDDALTTIERNAGGATTIETTAPTRLACLSLQLFRRKMGRDALNWVWNWMVSKAAHSFVAPGTQVGVMAAECIGEPAMQMTLNKFHFAGVCTVSEEGGITRMKEVINTSPKTNTKTPVMRIALITAMAKYRRCADRFAAALVARSLSDIASVEVVSAVDHLAATSGTGSGALRAAIFPDERDRVLSDPNGWIGVIKIDRAAAELLGLTPQSVARQIASAVGSLVHVEATRDVFASPLLGPWCVSVNLSLHTAAIAHRVEPSVSRRFRQRLTERICGVIIESIGLGGLKGVTNAESQVVTTSVAVTAEGRFESVDRYRVHTSGSCLPAVVSLTQVNQTKTICNRPNEVAPMLGIEAAGTVLFNEFVSTMTDGGKYVNHAHIATIVANMIRQGELTPNSRAGINKESYGVWVRASYEETWPVLCNAAVHHLQDKVVDRTTRIVFGQTPLIGAATVRVSAPAIAFRNGLTIATERERSQVLDTSNWPRGTWSVVPHARFSDGLAPQPALLLVDRVAATDMVDALKEYVQRSDTYPLYAGSKNAVPTGLNSPTRS